MKDDEIFLVTLTSSAVAADGALPLSVIARRRGCACQMGNNTVVLLKPGYYDVDATVTLTGAAGTASVQLYKGTTAVGGAVSSETITTASTEIHSLPVTGTVRVFCNEGPVYLSLVNTGVAITATNVALRVVYKG